MIPLGTVSTITAGASRRQETPSAASPHKKMTDSRRTGKMLEFITEWKKPNTNALLLPRGHHEEKTSGVASRSYPSATNPYAA
jgi:hypothetical protein